MFRSNVAEKYQMEQLREAIDQYSANMVAGYITTIPSFI